MNFDLPTSTSTELGRERVLIALGSGLAHEINNLLSAIIMLVDLWSGRNSSDRDRELLGMVGESARKGVALVRQLHGLARATGGVSTPFQARHLLVDVARFAEAAFAPPISVEVDFSPDLRLLEADPIPVYIALLELCQISRRRLPAGGVVALAVRNVEVDGLAAAMRSGLLQGAYLAIELTVAAGSAKVSEEERATVAALGDFAEIIAGEELDETLRVYFRADREPVGSIEPARSAIARVGHGELILIAEPSAIVGDAMARALEGHSYETLIARDGAEALALFARHSPTVALVIVGSGLRFLDGPDWVLAARHLKENVPALLLHGEEALPGAAELAPKARLLKKPFSLADLLTAVSASLASAKTFGS